MNGTGTFARGLQPLNATKKTIAWMRRFLKKVSRPKVGSATLVATDDAPVVSRH